MTGKDQQHNNRKRRLSAALRDNLKRRKAQARDRASADAGPRPATHDSAGIGGDKRERQP